MNKISNNSRMSAILKEFANGKHESSYLKIKKDMQEFPNELIARYNAGVIAEKNQNYRS